MTQRASTIAGACLLFLLASCGSGRGGVSGTVTFQGKTVQTGTVTMLGQDGIPKSALIENGSYHVKDIHAGPVEIAVTSPDPVKSIPATRPGAPPPPKGDRTGWFPIPEDYGDFKKSGLTYQVKRGANSFDIELK